MAWAPLRCHNTSVCLDEWTTLVQRVIPDLPCPSTVQRIEHKPAMPLQGASCPAPRGPWPGCPRAATTPAEEGRRQGPRPGASGCPIAAPPGSGTVPPIPLTGARGPVN